MEPDAKAFLERWHRIVAERDLTALHDVLAADVTLGAPPYWNKLTGRPVVERLLGLILETIDGFRYRREWVAGRELALEFHGRVGELELQGIDLITLDADGRIASIDVPMRPMNAVAALRERIAPRMAEWLAQRAARA
jgi:hypothetical protein